MAELLSIAAKSIPYRYRGYVATLTYHRDDKLWHWEFTNVVETKFKGKSKTIDDARKQVQKHVDILIGPGAVT